MEYFAEAFNKAVALMLSLDPELYGIIFLSIKISVIATIISTIIGMPLGALIGLNRFWGRTALINLTNTFMGMPPVVVGLVVYILLSNQIGLLGPLRLLFTPTAMIIAQVLLATPIISGLTIVAVQGVDPLLRKTAVSLGANGPQLGWIMIREARYAIGAAVITAFGRLTAEVGAVMMVGGNIRFQTRVMTTAIALHKGMGEFQMALALGMILLAISLLINSILDMLRRGRGAVN
ncbi:MAG TPA: ABC transporter permease [Negativicutes bacterium]|nr:ABC transporter permease [Negativicutes bacterium]